MKNILLIGGGKHCGSVIDAIKTASEFNIIGILDIPEKVGETIEGVPIVGEDNDLAKWREKGIDYAFITVGSIGDSLLRQKLFEKAKNIGYVFPIIKDPTAIVSETAQIKDGTFVGKGAIINNSVTIGESAIINSGAIIEHDSTIGSFCHIAPGTTLSGSVTIGSYTHIGTNTTIIQDVVIGEQTIIGAGSVVVRDIGSQKVAFGNPCKEAKK